MLLDPDLFPSDSTATASGGFDPVAGAIRRALGDDGGGARAEALEGLLASPKTDPPASVGRLRPAALGVPLKRRSAFAASGGEQAHAR